MKYRVTETHNAYGTNLSEGDIVVHYTGPTYGVIDDNIEVACSLDGRTPFFGVAKSLIEPVEEIVVQWCDDHGIAWTDGGDCWGAGINGIDKCHIRVRKMLWFDE